MIILLLILFIIMLIASYFLFKKEIMQPAIVFCAAYTISILCAVFNIDKWGIELNQLTFWILLLGGLEFVIISYIVHIIFKKKNSSAKSEEINKGEEVKEKKEQIKISNIFIILLIIYNVIILALLLTNVLSIASQFGEYNNFSEALTLYKQNTSYSKKTELPDYLTILMKPIISAAYIGVFVFFYNVTYSEEKIYKRILKNSHYLIFPIHYFIQRFMESNRGSILNFCIAAVAMAIIIWSMKNKWKKHINIKIIITIVIIACLGMVLFYYSAGLVGRINRKGMFDYITYYIGGSIECFNQWVQNPDEPTVVAGEYTFSRTIRDLGKLGILDYQLNNENYSNFIYYKGEMVGNIYTSYRSWMHDWGIAGIVILQAILALTMNILYNIIKYSKYRAGITNYLIITYGYLIYTIFLHPIDSYFYLETFTIATAGVFIVMTPLYYMAVTLKVNFKGGFKITYKDKKIVGLGEKND